MGNHGGPAKTAMARRTGTPAVRAAPAYKAGAARNFITEGAVAAWTRGNAPGVPPIAYHYGTDEHLARLARDGVDVTRNLHGTLGRGFYMFARPGSTTNPNTGRPVFEGEPMRVAVRMRQPFVGTMAEFKARVVDRAMADPRMGRADADMAALITEEARRQGYDGLVVSGIAGLQGRDSTYVVAIVPGSVRVIRGGDGGATPPARATGAKAASPEDANVQRSVARAVAKAGPERVDRVGAAKSAVYRAWARLSKAQTTGMGGVVGFIPAVGVFSLRGRDVYAHSRTAGGMAVAEKATPAQLAEIDRAIERGTFQMEWRRYSGISGSVARQRAEANPLPTRVLYRARGRPLVGDEVATPRRTRAKKSA